MKKSIFLSVLVVIFAVVLVGCKKKDDGPALSNEALITAVSTSGFTLTQTATGGTISGTIAKTANLGAVQITFTISANATSNPASPATLDLNSPKPIVVTAQDGTTTKTYTVSATQ